MAIQILPSDIIADILSRLPVKPLFRFKCVSKPWKSLISSSNFIKLHLSKTQSSDNYPMLIFSSFSLSIASIDDTIIRFTELHHPLLHFPDCLSVKILGSCNGVVCFSPFDQAYTCLYNPSTKTHRLQPCAPSHFPKPDRKTMFLNCPKKHVYLYGFGYDSKHNDYKVLRMLDYYKNGVFVGSEACLYSLTNGSWNYVSDDDGTCGICSEEATLFDEVLYFVVDNNGKSKAVIKCFDLQTELFSLMDLPRSDAKAELCLYYLEQIGRHLYMMLNYQNHDSDSRFGRTLIRADLWIMKESSWVRLFSISEPASINASLNIKPLVFSRDGRRILFDLDSWSFGWYDWESKELVRVLSYGLPPHNMPFNTWTFVESLVSLAKPSGNLKEKVVRKKKNKNDADGFLSSGFKLRL